MKIACKVDKRITVRLYCAAESGISRPKELSGKRYASYGARYEGRIVQQMIKNDGGDGEYIEDTTMGMLGVWKTLLTGKADATWVFMAWEGVMAKLGGVELNVFQLDDYKVCVSRLSRLRCPLTVQIWFVIDAYACVPVSTRGLCQAVCTSRYLLKW